MGSIKMGMSPTVQFVPLFFQTEGNACETVSPHEVNLLVGLRLPKGCPPASRYRRLGVRYGSDQELVLFESVFATTRKESNSSRRCNEYRVSTKRPRPPPSEPQLVAAYEG